MRISTGKQAVIAGISAYVPEKILDNHAFAQTLDTSDAWISERTGIKERRILEKHQPTSYIGIKSVKDLLKKTNTPAESIDLIVCGTNTPDHRFPATAAKIAYETNCTQAAGFDIQAACPAFVYALIIATQFIGTGYCKKIIVLGIDKMSSCVDYEDRDTAVLFGDGGGAVLLVPSKEKEVGIIDSLMYMDGKGREELKIPSGGSLKGFDEEALRERSYYLKQNGKAVFKEAVRSMAQSCYELLIRNNLTTDDIDYLIPHQANLRIIQAINKQLQIDPQKVIINIDRYGNTSAGTIPTCLWENEQKFKKGDKLILSSFGAGYIWASIYLIWGYDTPSISS